MKKISSKDEDVIVTPEETITLEIIQDDVLAPINIEGVARSDAILTGLKYGSPFLS